MSEVEKIIVCMPWGEQSCPSVMRLCCECGTELALDRDNAVLNFKTSCIPCVVKKDGLTFGGAAIGGEIYTDLLSALAALPRDRLK